MKKLFIFIFLFVSTNNSTYSQTNTNCTSLVTDFGDKLEINWNKDDGSSPEIILPFTFCFFGEQYSSVYMNNNGNISFLDPNSTYSAFAFPSSINRIIAGFWSDFDFENCGEMYVNNQSNYTIFTWKNAGYYDNHCDILNTFQLILSDGNDPINPNGNISLRYGDMNWTTGDGTNGINGFQGTPATIGVNRGNGIDYFELGHFNQPTNQYDGIFGMPDGVNWLDNRRFDFNVCGDSLMNIAPVLLTKSSCDQLKICSLGDTLALKYDFIAPELNQTTTVTFSCNTLELDTFESIIGYEGVLKLKIPGNKQLIGKHALKVTAIDNGIIPRKTEFIQEIEILNGDSIIPIIPKLNANSKCPPFLITLNDSTFDAYKWNNDSITSNYFDTLFSNSSEHVLVTLFKNNCAILIDTVIKIPQKPLINLKGNYTYCANANYTTLEIQDSSLYGSITCKDSMNEIISHSYGLELSKGNYQITLFDSLNKCSTDTFIVIKQFNPIQFTGINHTCDSLLIFNGNSGGSSSGKWLSSSSFLTILSPDSLNTTFTSNSIDTFLLVYNDVYCNTKDSLTVYFSKINKLEINHLDTICFGDSTLVSIVSSKPFTQYTWDNKITNMSSIYLSQGSHYLAVKNDFGCELDTNITLESYPVNLLTHPSSICGDTIHFSNNTGYAFGGWDIFSTDGYCTFQNESSQLLNPTINVSNPGNYLFRYTDNRCFYSDTIRINFNFPPFGQINSDIVCDGFNRYLTFTPKYLHDLSTILWSTGDTTKQIKANDSGIYTISATNPCGSNQFSIELEKNNCEIEIPNVFTPNSDNVNDVFELLKVGSSYTFFEFTILNRWGNQVITFLNPQFKWDGKDQEGNELSEGIYFYTLKADSNEKTGFIQLIR